MRIIVYLPFIVSALLGLAIPRFGRRLPPVTATRLLVAAAVACAMSSVLALLFLAWTYVGQVPLIAALGDWSVRLVKAHDPVPPQTAQVALLVLGGVGALTMRTVVRQGMAWANAIRTCRQSSARPGGMVVVDDPVPHACAVPGRFGDRGRVVVTTGMLRALNADERQVMLAHERAHLRDRHHLYRTCAAIAASMNPLLVALPRAVEYATERWADEQAAEDVGDRRLAARAVARAGLATARHARHAQTAHAVRLDFGDGDVPNRVTKLLTAPPPRHPLTAAVLIVAVIACLFAVNEARADTESLFEQAQPHQTIAAAAISRHAAHIPGTDGVRQVSRGVAASRFPR